MPFHRGWKTQIPCLLRRLDERFSVTLKWIQCRGVISLPLIAAPIIIFTEQMHVQQQQQPGLGTEQKKAHLPERKAQDTFGSNVTSFWCKMLAFFFFVVRNTKPHGAAALWYQTGRKKDGKMCISVSFSAVFRRGKKIQMQPANVQFQRRCGWADLPSRPLTKWLPDPRCSRSQFRPDPLSEKSAL